MNKKKYSAWQGFVQALSLPEEAFISQSHMEVFGEKEIVLEGAKRIIEYSDKMVRLQVKGRSILIQGDRLGVDMFLENTVVVRGVFSTIVFE